jgi:RimJ/RimL family protein N-acetyltransferase
MRALHRTPPLRLDDGVVALRPWRSDDLAELVRAVDDEEIYRWIDLIPRPYRDGDGRAYLRGCRRAWRDGSGAPFAITDSSTDRVLGSIDLRLSPERDVGEVGYWIRADARGQGLATRALVLVSRWGLERPGIARLQLRADAANRASRRVAERAGYTFEGILRSERWSARQQRRLDWAMYSLLPGELEAARSVPGLSP